MKIIRERKVTNLRVPWPWVHRPERKKMKDRQKRRPRRWPGVRRRCPLRNFQRGSGKDGHWGRGCPRLAVRPQRAKPRCRQTRVRRETTKYWHGQWLKISIEKWIKIPESERINSDNWNLNSVQNFKDSPRAWARWSRAVPRPPRRPPPLARGMASKWAVMSMKSIGRKIREKLRGTSGRVWKFHEEWWLRLNFLATRKTQIVNLKPRRNPKMVIQKHLGRKNSLEKCENILRRKVQNSPLYWHEVKSYSFRKRERWRGRKKRQFWTKMFNVFLAKMPHVSCWTQHIPRIKTAEKIFEYARIW